MLTGVKAATVPGRAALKLQADTSVGKWGPDAFIELTTPRHGRAHDHALQRDAADDAAGTIGDHQLDQQLAPPTARDRG